MATICSYSERLKPFNDNLYLIISNNESTLKSLEKNAYRISSNRFFSHSINMLEEGDYYSCHYYNRDGGKEFVLPCLLLRLEQGVPIDNIINKYKGL